MMKNNILNDLGTAARLFKDIRQARKDGKTLEIKQSIQVPCFKPSASFLDTVEGCALAGYSWRLYESVKPIFDTFSYNEKRMLAFAPKDGDFVERVQFWQNTLKYTIEPTLYHVAIFTIIQWFIHIKQMRP
jgi:hypothetical protein